MRRVAWTVLAVAGCSFTPGTAPSSSADAADPTIDASIDANPDAPRTWQVIETMTVETSSGTPQMSQTVLAAGVTYRLRASGVMSNVIDPYPGDADYFDFADPKDLGCCEDIGLGINDLDIYDKITTPDWGAYTTTHVYEVDWVGAGASISALFQDTYYGNNVGDLTLEILELR